MSAPTPTARTNPGGIPLEDGWPSFITFALDPDISFWEVTVQPVGQDAGDAIDQTTMHNDRYRTKAPRGLVDTPNTSHSVAYDPAVQTQITVILGRKTTVTYTYSDGSTDAVYGFLKSFIPDALTEGEQPRATIEVVHTNWDPSAKVEAGHALSSVAGT